MGIIQSIYLPFLLFLLALNMDLSAQNTSKAYNYEGKWVEDIVVEKGRTIYNLTKTYQITEAELLQLNPELKDGLKSGMKLRVPSLQKQPGQKTDSVQSKTPDLKGAIKHTVKTKETIYGIARMYGVEIEDLYALNPHINEGLSVGMVVTVYPKPSSRPPSKEQLQVADTLPAETKADKPVRKKCSVLADKERGRTLKISLMLPFFISSGEDFNARSRIGLDFLAGARMAADSLKAQGYSMNIHVFDTQNDSNSTGSILNSPDFATSDLIIGPLYSQAFLEVADKARKLNIPAVSPFSQSEALIEGFPNVAKVTPSDEVQMKELAEKLKLNFPNAKFTLIKTDSPKDKYLTESFLQSWNASDKPSKPALNQISFNEFRSDQSSLDNTKENIVLMLSNEEVKLIELTNKLEKLTYKYRLRLAGLQSWNLLDNVDMDLLNKLRFTYASYLWQNFNSTSSLGFQRQFLNEYKGEPTYYAYQGFDVTYFFCKFIADYGKDAFHCLPSLEDDCGLNVCYRFESDNEKNGYENKGIRLVELNNFQELGIDGNK